MGASRYRELTAYRVARELADELYAQISEWDKFDRWTVGVQLVRSSDSVAANIAEAMGRYHVPDQRRILLFARGSLYETEHWIECAHARGLLDPAPFQDRVSETARTLAGLIKQPQPG